MYDLLKLTKSISKYCVGMEGNVSEKLTGGLFTIKASGAQMSKMAGEDFVIMNHEGAQVSNFDRKPSMEVGFHQYLLGLDGVNFVAHTHPTNTMKILCSGCGLSRMFSEYRIFPDQVLFNGRKSCLVPYATPGEKLANTVEVWVNDFISTNKIYPKLILLKNHGIIACGRTAEECIIITDICEKSAEIFLGASEIGNVLHLTDSEMDEILVHENEKYRLGLVQ